jgi:hypothetical protein
MNALSNHVSEMSDGFDYRIGHCGVLHMTVESMHASCLRCLDLPQREMGGSTP